MCVCVCVCVCVWVGVCVCGCVCVCMCMHVVHITHVTMATNIILQVFIAMLVKDRYEKHLMEQNGLSRWTYWLVKYCFNFIFYAIIAVVVSVFAFAFQIRLFTQVGGHVLSFLLPYWGSVSVGYLLCLPPFSYTHTSPPPSLPYTHTSPPPSHTPLLLPPSHMHTHLSSSSPHIHTHTHKTNALVLIVTLFLWGHAQVVLGFFFSNFFSQPRTGIIIGYLLVIAGVVVALLLEFLQVG